MSYTPPLFLRALLLETRICITTRNTLQFCKNILKLCGVQVCCVLRENKEGLGWLISPKELHASGETQPSGDAP
jgi:hypothetical protein